MNDNESDPYEWNETLLSYITFFTFSLTLFPIIVLFMVLFRAVLMSPI